MYMDGRAVFRWAVAILCDTIQDVLKHSGLTSDQIDLYIPHQANIRIINSILSHTGLAPERLVTNLERYGNTAAASVPIAMTEALDAGRINNGDLVLLAGFGAGMTWGSALLEWGGAAA